MIRYLTGSSTVGSEEIAFKVGLGLMIQPGNSYHLKLEKYPFWAADNGAFTKKPGGFNEDKFMAMLNRSTLQDYAGSCLFVVAPDVLVVLPCGTVVGDAAGTLAQFPKWATHIHSKGLPVALVAQDGMQHLLREVPWHHVDCLFIGGSDEWKTSEEARVCIVEARNRGKLVHMGRVNGFRRLARASEMLCDTADGTYLMFGPKVNLPNLLGWLEKVSSGIQSHLPWGQK